MDNGRIKEKRGLSRKFLRFLLCTDIKKRMLCTKYHKSYRTFDELRTSRLKKMYRCKNTAVKKGDIWKKILPRRVRRSTVTSSTSCATFKMYDKSFSNIHKKATNARQRNSVFFLRVKSYIMRQKPSRCEVQVVVEDMTRPSFSK